MIKELKEEKKEYVRFSDIKKYQTEYLSNKPELSIVEHKDGRRLLIKRVGKCQPEKCHSACCKFIHVNGDGYFKGFGKYNKKTDGTVIEIKCKHLCRNKCKLWDSKKFPGACKQFPHIADEVYGVVEKVCTFKFEVIEELIKR